MFVTEKRDDSLCIISFLPEIFLPGSRPLNPPTPQSSAEKLSVTS